MLDPRLKPVVDAANAAFGAPAPESIAERRASVHESMEQTVLSLFGEGPEVASIVDHTMPVDGGEIGVRVYTPRGAGPFPAHLYLHGGGFWVGEPRHFDPCCASTAAGAGCVVASVDYRLAPEHKFPVAVDDSYAGLLWLVEHADDLAVDASRISVGGASAGGNLAAVVALMARDRAGPRLVFQVLECPVTDLTMSCPSFDELGDGYLLTRDMMEQSARYYVEDPRDAKHPYVSPLFAPDLSELPPALVMTGELDPLRDEGEAYGERLLAAGVPTRVRRWEGHIHGSQQFARVTPDDAAAYREMICDALRDAYRATG